MIEAQLSPLSLLLPSSLFHSLPLSSPSLRVTKKTGVVEVDVGGEPSVAMGTTMIEGLLNTFRLRLISSYY